MKKYLIGIMILCSMIWAMSARADSITLEEVGVTPAQVIRVSLGSSGTASVYVGAYELKIDGVPITSYCIDYLHWAPDGPNKHYDLVPLSMGTKYSDLAYNKAAYIAQQHPATSNNFHERVNAQLAMWEILSGGTDLLTGDFRVWDNNNSLPGYWTGWGSYSDAQSIVTLVQNQPLSFWNTDFTTSFQLAKSTIDGVNSTQDYIVPKPPTPVPEPTTILLLGFGLIGVAVLRRRLKK